MKGAQVGGTEGGNSWIGYIIHQAPGPMLAVSPTVELAKRNSKQRIDPLIEESDVLRELVKPARSRDSGNTVLSKEFPGGALMMTGANSAVGLCLLQYTSGNCSESQRSLCKISNRCRTARRWACHWANDTSRGNQTGTPGNRRNRCASPGN